MAVPQKRSMQKWLERLESQLDLEALMQGCCKAFLEIAGADRCSIMVLDTDTEQLMVRWAEGSRVQSKGQHTRFRMGEGLCGTVARSQKAFCTFDTDKEPRFLPYQKAKKGFKPVKAICCLPLMVEGQTVGVVNLSSFSSSKRLAWAKQASTRRFLDRLARVIFEATLLHEAQALSKRWQRQMKATSETIAQVSHEVRTPLTLIKEGAQQLLDEFAGPLESGQKERVEIIKRQSNRMLSLVTELLDLSRVEAGRLVLDREPIDLKAIVGEVKTGYETLVAPRTLELNLQEIPLVYGDRNRLAQILENLLTNAVKFTPPTGTIRILLSPHGRSVELAVQDTGIGIAKRAQQRLFEKFFQPSTPVTFGGRGTGLGLAIVKEISQLHGGTVRVQSTPGKGTTFTVSLPSYSPAFALTEEFRVMREQAAREGGALAFQAFQFKGEKKLSFEPFKKVIRKHVSKADRILENPNGEGLLLLSVLQPEGFEAMKKRLAQVFRSEPGLSSEALVWGWALVPQEATSLPEATALTERRSQGESVHATH